MPPRGLLFPNWDSRKASVYAPITPPTRKLSDVTDAFGIDIANAHQALDDTYAVAEIVAAITPRWVMISHSIIYFLPGQPEPSGLFKLRPVKGITGDSFRLTVSPGWRPPNQSFKSNSCIGVGLIFLRHLLHK